MNLTISPRCLELSSALELTLFVMKCHFVKKVGKTIYIWLCKKKQSLQYWKTSNRGNVGKALLSRQEMDLEDFSLCIVFLFLFSLIVLVNMLPIQNVKLFLKLKHKQKTAAT